MAGRVRAAWAVPAVAVAAALLVLGGSRRTADLVHFRASCGEFSLAEPPDCLQEDRASFLRAIDYIDRSTPPEAVFLTAKPEALYYYAHRRSVLLQATFVATRGRYVDELRRQGVDYVLIGSLHADELVRLAPRLRRHCRELEVEAFFAPRTYLLRIRAPGSPAGTDACRALKEHEKANIGRRFTEDRA